jgi:hypothetical protein
LEELYEFAIQGNLSKIQGTFGSISDDVIQNSRNGIISIAVAERDRVVAECEQITNSNIWKYSKLYRSL